ncbi:MAG: 1-acyl-sn-glycerol-3-phosphate acyltransferase, partial [Betaproteobacteria bacterium]|nr:1-acyl-sn-glycerol-3-phosphate acyltransferase [Betaproteobacteria bacterium]
CGLAFEIQAAPDGVIEPQPGELVVMNHISFIDILALDALRPVHFIAKSEIRKWPVIGILCDRTGTIFIERGKRHAVHDVLKTMANELRQGEVVSFFPEGTTSDGRQLLPFHANLFEAAVRSTPCPSKACVCPESKGLWRLPSSDPQDQTRKDQPPLLGQSRQRRYPKPQQAVG